MAAENPDITASDIITNINNRLGENISQTMMLPWVSYAYLKTYWALANAGQTVKEQLFGSYEAINLTNGTAEYSLSENLPRFGSVIKMEILYGATGDQRARVSPLRSIYQWDNQANVSTSYRSKGSPLYYILKDTLGIIPTPPTTDTSSAMLYIWYVQRPYQIDDGNDIIDIPYRFIYPMDNYVQAKAIQRANEDYSNSLSIERLFVSELDDIGIAASSEFNENEGNNGIEISSQSQIYDNPLGY